MRRDSLLLRFELDKLITIDKEMLPYEDIDSDIVSHFMKFKVSYHLLEETYELPLVLVGIGDNFTKDYFMDRLGDFFNNNVDMRVGIANFFGIYYENFALNYIPSTISLENECRIEHELPFGFGIKKYI